MLRDYYTDFRSNGCTLFWCEKAGKCSLSPAMAQLSGKLCAPVEAEEHGWADECAGQNNVDIFSAKHPILPSSSF